jgi:hypothetical protein
LVNETTNLNYFTKQRNEIFFLLFYALKQEIWKWILFFSSKAKKGKMTTIQDQEMNSGPNADHKESLIIPSRQIKEDSRTCLKTLSIKQKKSFDAKKAMMRSELGYRLL